MKINKDNLEKNGYTAYKYQISNSKYETQYEIYKYNSGAVELIISDLVDFKSEKHIILDKLQINHLIKSLQISGLISPHNEL